jgi:hypothetical protein
VLPCSRLSKLFDKYIEWKASGTLLPGAFERQPDVDNVRSSLFYTPPVEWNRLPQLQVGLLGHDRIHADPAADLDAVLAWQDVSVRLLAQRGVFRGNAPPSTRKRWTLRGVFASHRANPNRRPSLGAEIDAASELYLQDEMAHAKISLPPPLVGRKYHLFCSEFNAGAFELACELRESDVFVTKGKEASVVLTFTTDASQLAECDHSSHATARTGAQLLCALLLT